MSERDITRLGLPCRMYNGSVLLNTGCRSVADGRLTSVPIFRYRLGPFFLRSDNDAFGTKAKASLLTVLNWLLVVKSPCDQCRLAI